jgi:hypothetical protein
MRRGRRESARRRVRALHLLYNHIKYFKREREREIKTDTRRESERERTRVSRGGESFKSGCCSLTTRYFSVAFFVIVEKRERKKKIITHTHTLKRLLFFFFFFFNFFFSVIFFFVFFFLNAPRSAYFINPKLKTRGDAAFPRKKICICKTRAYYTNEHLIVVLRHPLSDDDDDEGYDDG